MHWPPYCYCTILLPMLAREAAVNSALLIGATQRTMLYLHIRSAVLCLHSQLGIKKMHFKFLGNLKTYLYM